MLQSGAIPPDSGEEDHDDSQLDVKPDEDGRAQLLSFINKEADQMARFRETIGLKQRLHTCARMRQGVYDPAVLAAIKQFGGSEVYARIVSNKIRGSYAVLSEIFIQGERPWAITPTPEPQTPEDINAEITNLLQQEVQAMTQAGMPPPQAEIEKRADMLQQAAREAALKRARADADKATEYIDDILVEGGFYNELRLFLLDFCTYPVAIMHGPVAVMKTQVSYVNGQPMKVRRPVNEFRRINPHDLLWSAGATRIEDAAVYLRQRLSRAQLAGLVGLDGYDDTAIKAALGKYADGYHDTRYLDQSRATAEDQQNPSYDDLLDVCTYMGAIPGWMLAEDFGIEITGEDTFDYLLVVVRVGEFILKVSLDPDPRARLPFYTAAYEASADSIAGDALPELIADIEECTNATFRAMINNLAIASGPQVVADLDRLDTTETLDMYPWKVWKVVSDPAMASLKVVDFFQPSSNVQELQMNFQFLSQLADEVSAIPRYLTGNERVGGAGRTASGLSMLMGNASRSMVSIASSLDINVIDPLLHKLYDLVLLTTGLAILRGDEKIQVRGATFAQTREQDRMRQLEFLQITNNPVDLQIMGLPGRSKVLRKVSHNIGMGGEEVVPDDVVIQQQLLLAQQQAAQQGQQPGGPQGAGPEGGGPPQQPGGPKQEKSAPNQTAEETDNSQRTRSPRAINPTQRAA